MKKVIFLLMAFAIVAVSLVAQESSIISPAPTQVKMRFEEREPFLVMGLETMGTMESDDYMEAWTKFFSLREKLPETVDNCIYGIYYPGEKFDPKTMKGNNYLVGMEVKESVELPKELKLIKAPGGYFAVFDHVGSVKDIGETYEYIFGPWLATSGYIPVGAEMYERYDERFKESSANSVIEIWVPVQKLESDVKPPVKIEKEPALKETPKK
ncbi:MAG: GyrI-like domain-containing protein [Candidatus Cloacimonadaceae bacterium]|jgi:AraC family transcriptional regulator|nr:GyrI-like domain-containing protein [Candidatus Cloacimonadota bacterium]MDX9949546.1 GyrI-like domain-containing protein [Candidatus Syntrophosphaera sp.]NLN85112.1 GyrI-like domain-containing protein [Candidatus Cloacimonadota bacterium]